MKSDRMAAFEAPRSTVVGRATRDVELRFHGHNLTGRSRETVCIPQAMKLPDLISFRGHTFVKRTDEMYSEGTIWPILEELEGR